MGEVTEMILDGILCMECGGFVDESSNGFPRKCDVCEDDDES